MSEGEQGPADDGDEGVPSVVGERLAAAARRSGLGRLAEEEGAPNGAALLSAMGGVRGLAETILPGLVFLVVYTIWRSVPAALGASVGMALVFTILRLALRSPVTQAVAGLVGVGASAILALITGKGSDNFILGLFLNGGYGVGLFVSVLVGWPLIGLAVGYLMGEGVAWKHDRFKRRTFRWLTLCWVALFAVRLAVELPLYFADNVGGLALTKLLMGVPLYAPLVLLTWLVVRSAYGLRPAAGDAGRD